MNLKPHDFTKPARLSAVWHERLMGWCRAALLLANKTWSKQLPIRLEGGVNDWEGLYAHQALSQLPDPCLAYRVMVGEKRFPTFLIMPRSLMLNLVGVLLGEEANASAGDRELTLVEEGLADYFLADYWLSAFRESWPAAHPATWVLEGREASPATSRVFGADEVLLTLSWHIRGPWGETNGIWLFPKKALLSALGSNEKPDAAPQAAPAGLRESVVQTLPLVVQIILGTTELKLSELRRLQVGDVLMLDESQEDQAVARVGSRALYQGRVGRTGTWKAFQVKSLLEK